MPIRHYHHSTNIQCFLYCFNDILLIISCLVYSPTLISSFIPLSSFLYPIYHSNIPPLPLFFSNSTFPRSSSSSSFSPLLLSTSFILTLGYGYSSHRQRWEFLTSKALALTIHTLWSQREKNTVASPNRADFPCHGTQDPFPGTHDPDMCAKIEEC